MKISTKSYAMIMAGGRGERFWPVGRASHPKQFVDIFGGKPLIRHAVERLKGVVPTSHIIVVTSHDLLRATRKALPEIPAENIIGEPQGRDTAAACAVGTAWVKAHGGSSATMCVVTADQLIADEVRFRATLSEALELVATNSVMSLIGIKPTFAATGYGYVKLAGAFKGRGASDGFENVECFVEKPNLGTAATYLKSGRYLWNSGMFVWRVDTFVDALRKYQPQLADMVETLCPLVGKREFATAFKAAYDSLAKISIDYAVMEKADNLVAARGDFGWDDVGTWVSAAEHFDGDAEGNNIHGQAICLAAENNAVVNTDQSHLVAVFGADDLVVVHTKEATLVCPKAAADGLKALVKEIGANAALAKFTK